METLTQQGPNNFFELLDLMKGEFEVKDAYLWNSVPTFLIASTPKLEEKIDGLREKLKAKEMQILLRKNNGDLVLQVVPLQAAASAPSKFLSLNYSFILFMITVITVTISGYFTAKTFIDALKILKGLGRNIQVDEGLNLIGLTAAYTISIMAVLGFHELGHTLACRRHHIEASLPIFIPGIPLVTPGTFGALIRQKSPALNRNQLFDIGFSGPFIGFVVALIVSYLGYSWSIPVSWSEDRFITAVLGEGQPIFLPLAFDRLSAYILPNPNSYTHILHPLAEAGWITTLITFLNIFPIGQLDGGHISRALFGAKWHRLVSYLMISVMILAGWWSMAFLILILLRGDHPGTLDEVTEVSRSRKFLSVLVVVIFLSCFTLSPESLLLNLLYR